LAGSNGEGIGLACADYPANSTAMMSLMGDSLGLLANVRQLRTKPSGGVKQCRAGRPD